MFNVQCLHMESVPSSLDPLADYVEPQFGDIYATEHWTPELEQVIVKFLVKAHDDSYATFVKELLYAVPIGSRREQAVFIVRHHCPSEVAVSYRLAVVKAVPIFE